MLPKSEVGAAFSLPSFFFLISRPYSPSLSDSMEKVCFLDAVEGVTLRGGPLAESLGVM